MRKKQTSRPEIWKTMGKNAKLQEKQKRSHEKLHLDNARKLRGIYFIDMRTRNSKKPLRELVRSWKHQLLLRWPCNIMKNCGAGGSNKIKTRLACMLEADESKRLRMGNSVPNHHEDHIAGKGNNSLQHYNLVHKFIPMPRAMKIPAAKAAVENLEKLSAWNLTKVRSKKEVIDEARTSCAKVHFESLTDSWRMPNQRQSIKNTNVELYSEVIL